MLGVDINCKSHLLIIFVPVGVDDDFQQLPQPFFRFVVVAEKFGHVAEECWRKFLLEKSVQCRQGSAPQKLQLFVGTDFIPDVGEFSWRINLILQNSPRVE